MVVVRSGFVSVLLSWRTEALGGQEMRKMRAPSFRLGNEVARVSLRSERLPWPGYVWGGSEGWLEDGGCCCYGSKSMMQVIKRVTGEEEERDNG